jgi:DNA-binding transcriptional MerR regulator
MSEQSSARAIPLARQNDSHRQQALTIDVVARMFSISTFGLRLVEFLGLIRRETSPGGAKVYTWASCEQIALLVRARKSGLRYRDVAPIIRAMRDSAPLDITDTGRSKCLALVNVLEVRRQSISHIMDELYRIDWELSERLRTAPISARSTDTI